MEHQRRMKDKNEEIEVLKAEVQRLRREKKEEAGVKDNIVKEHINAEAYLKELVEEFKNGMKAIYQDDIQFKDLEDEDLTFCERFSNLLYNILLIIDYQKKFIKERERANEEEVSEEDSEEEELPKENKTLRLLQEELYASKEEPQVINESLEMAEKGSKHDNPLLDSKEMFATDGEYSDWDRITHERKQQILSGKGEFLSNRESKEDPVLQEEEDVDFYGPQEAATSENFESNPRQDNVTKEEPTPSFFFSNRSLNQEKKLVRTEVVNESSESPSKGVQPERIVFGEDYDSNNENIFPISLESSQKKVEEEEIERPQELPKEIISSDPNFFSLGSPSNLQKKEVEIIPPSDSDQPSTLKKKTLRMGSTDSEPEQIDFDDKEIKEIIPHFEEDKEEAIEDEAHTPEANEGTAGKPSLLSDDDSTPSKQFLSDTMDIKEKEDFDSL